MSHIARRAVRKARAVPSGMRRVVDQQQARSTVLRSGWFDGAWYLRQYPELVVAGVTDPLDHYVRWGAREGRSPGPDFDADAYRIMNPAAGDHPLLHYLARPRRGGALPAPSDCIDPEHPVLRSGCFDAEWYCRTYGDAVRTDIHPLVDYVWHGIPSGRNPGPVFHGPRYLHEYPDATTWRSPIHHFLAEGCARGMFPTALDEPGPTPLRGPLLLPRRVDVESVGPRIAVVVHAYYVEVLADLLTAVATLPTGYRLFVAVREEADVARATNVVRHVLGAEVHVDIRVTPNRGRNFGPLLFEFHRDVLAHDYVLHLHTKKSEHLGGHGDHWRRHQVQSLAGTPAISAMMLSLLESDPGVGVVHASPFWQLPYWVCHWLGNGRLGAPLLARLGVDAPAHGWVDYPVGGMFWARVDALRPLFEAGFTADEFEEEPAGTDGTLAHAVERVIDLTARHRGYRAVEFDLDTAQWRDDWSTRNAPPLERLPLDHLREQMLTARLVSVDLFDTLDLRPTLSPTTLQYFAARHLLTADEADQAVHDRLDAEAECRRTPIRQGDVTLDEIRSRLALERSDASELIRLEAAIEHDCAVPRPSLIALLGEARAAGVRLVMMSDTTLPRVEIEQLLAEVGAGDLFDELYISNEMLARKDTGTMWQVVEDLEQVPRSRWVHLGDNEFSDLQMPATLGIGHLHVPAPAGVAQFHGFIGTDPGHTRATQAVVGSATVGLFGEYPSDWSPARRLGYSGLGPLLAAFVGWLALHPASEAADHVLYVARDGALPFETVRRLQPFLPPSLAGGTYFLCSRRTALAVASADEPPLHLLLGGNFRGTLHDLLVERIGLSLPNDAELRRAVELPRQYDECCEALCAHRDAIRTHATEELAGFRWYLRSLGIEPRHTLALVDLGYSATTQRALATVVPNPIIGLYAATSPKARAAVADGLEVHALFGRDVDWGQGHAILDHSMLLEALFAADHGQVQGFHAGPTGLRVELKEHGRSDAEWAQVREAQQAAIEFCLDLVRRWGPAVFEEPIDAAAALDPWRHVLSPLTPWAAELFRDLTVDDQFTGFGRAPVR